MCSGRPRLEGRSLGLVASFWRAGLGAITAAALAGCGGGRAPAPAPPPPTVGVVTIEPQPVTLTTELPGRTNPYEIADVRPQVGGIVVARPFVEGAVVRAGQLLYQIEPAPYRALYDQAAAQLANAEANLTTTRLQAERYVDLVKIHAVSAQAADNAEAAYKQAEATVDQDRAATEAARINLDFTRVTAPISGKIGISTVTRGALVTPSQTAALDTIQKLDPIYVDVTQSAAQELALRQKMIQGGVRVGGAASAAVRLTLDDGSAYPLAGRLEFTDVTVDETTGAVTLRALFPNPAGLLLPGMYVRATVIEGVDPSGLLVPDEGVSRDARGNPTAMVVGPKGLVELRQLVLDETIGDKWLVASGLAPGDRVIVEGIQKAIPGSSVRPVEVRE